MTFAGIAGTHMIETYVLSAILHPSAMIPHHFRILFTFLFVPALAWPVALAQNLSDAQISLVEARLADAAKTRGAYRQVVQTHVELTHSSSWELGARSQALLELNVPTYSVLSSQPLPPATSIPLHLTDSMNAVLSIARQTRFMNFVNIKICTHVSLYHYY
jgi:hypothetical protein